MKDYLRRGLSAIVASVLMVLIVVVAVGVVWGVLIPLLDVDIASSQNAVSIDTSGGYTLYDAEQKLACVNIKKDLDVEIEGFKILFFFEGDSHEATISEQDDLPDFNQKKTYCFNLSNYEISPSRVSVVTLPEDNFVSSSIDLKEGTFTADFYRGDYKR